MKTFRLLCLAALLAAPLASFAQTNVEPVDLKGLEAVVAPPAEGTKVVVFWASWCKTCMGELPHIQQLHQEYKDKGVEFVLVSVDRAKQYEAGKVASVLEAKGVTAKALWMSEDGMGTWTEKVQEKWEGAVPATIIISPTDRRFQSGGKSYEELKADLEGFLEE